MGYRTIVVGTDGSVTAGVAQQTAARLAKRCRAQLVIVCCYGPPGISRQMAETLLSHAARAARRERVEPVTELRPGPPADAILEVAEERSADLVVVGNKGMGQATRFRLGSVPDRVAHSASTDLLIVNSTGAVRGPSDAEEHPEKLYTRIVVGTDGSPTASEAARKAFELAMMLRAEVTLVTASKDPIVAAILLERTESGRPEGVKVRSRVVESDPLEAIRTVALDEGAGLIVVGNKGMSGARRYLLGSVPNKVAHHAPTDVLIAKTVDRSVEEIVPGHGGVVDSGGRKVAVYRDEDGALHAVSPRCTHMGCTVDWNDAEGTWDCPCHGSRYRADGEVLRGPAEKSLAPQDL